MNETFSFKVRNLNIEDIRQLSPPPQRNYKKCYAESRLEQKKNQEFNTDTKKSYNIFDFKTRSKEKSNELSSVQNFEKNSIRDVKSFFGDKSNINARSEVSLKKKTDNLLEINFFEPRNLKSIEQEKVSKTQNKEVSNNKEGRNQISSKNIQKPPKNANVINAYLSLKRNEGLKNNGVIKNSITEKKEFNQESEKNPSNKKKTNNDLGHSLTTKARYVVKNEVSGNEVSGNEVSGNEIKEKCKTESLNDKEIFFETQIPYFDLELSTGWFSNLKTDLELPIAFKNNKYKTSVKIFSNKDNNVEGQSYERNIIIDLDCHSKIGYIIFWVDNAVKTPSVFISSYLPPS